MNAISNDFYYDPVLFDPQGNKAVKADKTARELESVFINQLLKEMNNTVDRDEDSDLFYSATEDTYREMFNQEMSREMARGEGIGLRTVIMAELEKQGELSDEKEEQSI